MSKSKSSSSSKSAPSLETSDLADYEETVGLLDPDNVDPDTLKRMKSTLNKIDDVDSLNTEDVDTATTGISVKTDDIADYNDKYDKDKEKESNDIPKTASLKTEDINTATTGVSVNTEDIANYNDKKDSNDNSEVASTDKIDDGLYKDRTSTMMLKDDLELYEKNMNNKQHGKHHLCHEIGVAVTQCCQNILHPEFTYTPHFILCYSIYIFISIQYN